MLASEAAVADALSTAFLVGGPELAETVCAARPGTLALIVLDASPDEILDARQPRRRVDRARPGIRVVRRAPSGRRPPRLKLNRRRERRVLLGKLEQHDGLG